MSDLLTKARFDIAYASSRSYFFQTFRNRLAEVIDQAQHFAALGPAGGGGQSGDSALAFREGLEVTERECESQVTVDPTAAYISGFEKCFHSRKKAQRRPNSGMSLRIGYDDDGVSPKRSVSARLGCRPSRSVVMAYKLVPPCVTRAVDEPASLPFGIWPDQTRLRYTGTGPNIPVKRSVITH